MSVIAKMSVRAIHDFGSGRLIELACVCENDLMAAYADSEEDRLFTKYSPSGEMKLNVPANFVLGEQDDKFYIMLLRSEEIRESKFPGSTVFGVARCVSLTDFGDNQAKRVEFNNGYRKSEHGKGIESFNWKMSVDNPGATSQFVPGIDDYWIALYPASVYNRDSAIHAAHEVWE